jgi:hypothetical protein
METRIRTGFNNIDPNVFNASVDLLFQERWRCMMYIVDSKGILGRKSRSSRHCIAPMRGNDFLVGFKPAVSVSVLVCRIVENIHTLHPSYPSQQSQVFASNT